MASHAEDRLGTAQLAQPNLGERLQTAAMRSPGYLYLSSLGSICRPCMAWQALVYCWGNCMCSQVMANAQGRSQQYLRAQCWRCKPLRARQGLRGRGPILSLRRASPHTQVSSQLPLLCQPKECEQLCPRQGRPCPSLHCILCRARLHCSRAQGKIPSGNNLLGASIYTAASVIKCAQERADKLRCQPLPCKMQP